MPRSKHPAPRRVRRCVVREELVAVCHDLMKDRMAALVLDQLLYLTERAHDVAAIAAEEVERLGSEAGYYDAEALEGWVPVTVRQLRDAVMCMSRGAVERDLNDLASHGLIAFREGAAGRHEYRVEWAALCRHLDRLGHTLHEYDMRAFMAAIRQAEPCPGAGQDGKNYRPGAGQELSRSGTGVVPERDRAPYIEASKQEELPPTPSAGPGSGEEDGYEWPPFRSVRTSSAPAVPKDSTEHAFAVRWVQKRVEGGWVSGQPAKDYADPTSRRYTTVTRYYAHVFHKLFAEYGVERVAALAKWLFDVQPAEEDGRYVQVRDNVESPAKLLKPAKQAAGETYFEWLEARAARSTAKADERDRVVEPDGSPVEFRESALKALLARRDDLTRDDFAVIRAASRASDNEPVYVVRPGRGGRPALER